jgi:hypothetical protein
MSAFSAISVPQCLQIMNVAKLIMYYAGSRLTAPGLERLSLVEEYAAGGSKAGRREPGAL